MELNNQDHQIKKDGKGRIRQINHHIIPYTLSEKPEEDTPKGVAAQYIKEVLDIKNVFVEDIGEKKEQKEKKSRKSENELWFVAEKQVMDTSVIEFEQRVNGIRLWKSGTTVCLNSDTFAVLNANNSFDYDVPSLKIDSKKLDEHSQKLDEKAIASLISLDKNLQRAQKVRKDIDLSNIKLKINKFDHVVYRYDPDARQEEPSPKENGDRDLVARTLKLVLPNVDKGIKEGQYCVSTEVFFSMVLDRLTMNWHTLIDYETNSVLYLRPLIAQISGWIYERDPHTSTGDTSILPSSPTDVLNTPRTPKLLPGITALPNLQGEYVAITEVLPPTVAAPTSAAGKFDYDADTDDFTAVNAYYHADAVFRMVEEMGFNMATYFDGTSFPVPVDHRGCFECVNAAAWGNAGGDGLGSFTFGVVEVGQPLGIATSVRIVLHEFGHAILWDNVHSPNYGFAHSAGDSMAALLCDPRSKAPDRGMTFPLLTAANPTIDRRHDRDIAAGWAWGGVNDDGQYGSEQILSTSHFRAYRSIGGDHPDLCEREWAARYMTYLILHGVGTLTEATNPNNPEDWCQQLIMSDVNTSVFEGHPGGTVHKVIRWAFEKQGAFQAPGAPTPVVIEGDPPEFDVYINDGRNGEYAFTQDYCHSEDIWNRNCPDAGPSHQAPIPGIDNYAYVVVRNRGTEKISGGRVHAFHKRDSACCDCCDDCHQLSWPNDFMPATTATLPFGTILPDDYQIVGPFVWRPGANDCLLMAADAKGDPSNINRIAPGNSLTLKRLVPLDNNIALRCLCKQCNPDYSKLKLKHPCREKRPNDGNENCDDDKQ